MIIEPIHIFSLIPGFLNGKQGDYEKSKYYIENIITTLIHSEKLITEDYVQDLTFWVEHLDEIEAFNAYHFLEQNFEQIDEFLKQSQIEYQKFRESPEHLNAEIIPEQNKWIKELLDKRKNIIESIGV